MARNIFPKEKQTHRQILYLQKWQPIVSDKFSIVYVHLYLDFSAGLDACSWNSFMASCPSHAYAPQSCFLSLPSPMYLEVLSCRVRTYFLVPGKVWPGSSFWRPEPSHLICFERNTLFRTLSLRNLEMIFSLWTLLNTLPSGSQLVLSQPPWQRGRGRCSGDTTALFGTKKGIAVYLKVVNKRSA